MTGDELRRIRQTLGLTQAALAELVGLTSNSIARQERGEVSIQEPQARLVKILAAQRAPKRKKAR